MKTHQFLITVKTSKDIPDLIDFVAGRAYTIDGVTDVAAELKPELNVDEIHELLLEAGWRPPVKPPSKLEWMQSPGTICRAVYVDSDEFKDYLAARFPKDGTPKGVSFEFDGHRWAYQVTTFDERGEYHLLWRPTQKAGIAYGEDRRTAPQDDGYRRVARVVSSKTVWGSKKKSVVYMDEIPENTYLYAKD